MCIRDSGDPAKQIFLRPALSLFFVLALLTFSCNNKDTKKETPALPIICLLYTSDAADERSSVDLGGRRIIKKKKKEKIQDQRVLQKEYTYVSINDNAWLHKARRC